jgi:putative transposase
MTEERLVLAELLEKAGEGDFLRAVAEVVLQLLTESDVAGVIGAGRYQRSGERTTWRNGYRDRTLDTRPGRVAAAHSQAAARQLPSAVSRNPQEALIAVIQEVWIGSVLTRCRATDKTGPTYCLSGGCYRD